jgi:molybdenum cofactor cytidylyltransferase
VSGAARPAHDTAIVLAAGRSRRMGRDKALLDFLGEPALGRMVRVLRDAKLDRIVVVTGEVRSALRHLVNLEGVTTAINPDPDSSQTRSIRIGLANTPPATRAFLLCPVDVPLFEVRDVRALIDAFAALPPGAAQKIVVPGDGARRGHPALFAAELRDEFQALSDSDPAHLVIRKDPSRVLHLPSQNQELFLDLDEESDYRAALERLRARSTASTRS